MNIFDMTLSGCDAGARFPGREGGFRGVLRGNSE
jgi:hypothetical protein